MPDYDYNPGDGLSVLDETRPNGATEPVSILDNAVKQIKGYLKDATVGPDARITEMMNTTRVIVVHGGGQTVAATDGQQVVEFDTEGVDDSDEFNVATFKFTATVAGLYLVITGLTVNRTASATPVGIVHQMDIYIDTTSGARSRVSRGTDDSVADMQLTRLFNLSAGQTLSVRYTLSLDSGTMTVEVLADPRETIFQVTKIPVQAAL